MEFLKKYILVLVTGIGLLAALILFSLNVPRNREANVIERGVMNLFAPVLKPIANVSGMAEDIWEGYISLVNVHRENTSLHSVIKELGSRLAAGDEALLENRRLKNLLDMKDSIKSPTVGTTVVGEDVSSWFRTLVIDRGASSGLKVGMAVVAADGVVGQVMKVAANTSRVLLLTDHASGIAATIQRSRARGVVKGKGEGLCTLEFTTREEDVKVGDLVVTSGIGGVYLKGLPIGEVTMVKRGQYGIFQTVTIRPSVNITRLEEVLVVLRGGYE
ncbi:MAG: rod shape-determining protein MreC [Desulfuromonadaceae bacterium]|nr:rod shape-determining protein MreC [Desulfuromonadaceae bacterium]